MSKAMMTNFKLLLIIFPTLCFVGCASVVSGSYQEVTLRVTCRGIVYPTYCVASNRKGDWKFKTPETKVIARDNSSLQIKCENQSIGDYSVLQYPIINPVGVGNVLVGGLIGAAIDVTSDAFWMYPKVISFESSVCGRFPK